MVLLRVSKQMLEHGLKLEHNRFFLVLCNPEYHSIIHVLSSYLSREAQNSSLQSTLYHRLLALDDLTDIISVVIFVIVFAIISMMIRFLY